MQEALDLSFDRLLMMMMMMMIAHGWNDSDIGKPKYWGETSASSALSNRDPTLGLNPVSAMIGQLLTA